VVFGLIYTVGIVIVYETIVSKEVENICCESVNNTNSRGSIWLNLANFGCAP
jgi:hypothetical protein